jgi:hypothetical protein
MPNSEIHLPTGAKLGYYIAVAGGEFELLLDGTAIARVDRPLSEDDAWYIADLAAGVHLLELSAKNLGQERYNAEVRLWMGDPNAPTWRTIFTYRNSGRPSDTGARHSVRLNVAGSLT